MLRKLIILLAIIFSGISLNFGWCGDAIRLESGVDRDTVAVGDPIRYTLMVTAPDSAVVIFPEYSDGIVGEFEISSDGMDEREGEGEKVYERWYLLQGFETGEFTLPAAAVRVKIDGKEELMESPPLGIVVESVLEASEGEGEMDIRPIKPPVSLPVSYLWILYLVGGIILLVVVVIVLIKTVFRRKEKVVPPPPPRPAHEIAYEQLERIKNENLPTRGLVKEYYSRVSNTARRYLENRFGLRAPERTTEEFLYDMASTDHLTVRQQDLVGDFLNECDLVKFARYGPTGNEIERVYNAAVRLVDETRRNRKESKQ
ncbi:MAG: BatD family protein [Candidatus Auribacterota bacterium]|nr:BatD family protein [Candidatus Auribacterota bacterium]